MGQEYSTKSRASDPHTLPDIEVFELTAVEQAERMEEELEEFMGRREYRLATMNSGVRARMLDAMVEELGIEGGWFWWACFPGCLPDSEPMGPFPTYKEALADARDDWHEEGE